MTLQHAARTREHAGGVSVVSLSHSLGSSVAFGTTDSRRAGRTEANEDVFKGLSSHSPVPLLALRPTSRLPWFLFALLFTGLEHPKFAAGAGIFWIVGTQWLGSPEIGVGSSFPIFTGRVIYTLGYISGDPKKRGPGFVLSRTRVVRVAGAKLNFAWIRSLVHHIGSLGLLGGSLYSAYSVIKAGL